MRALLIICLALATSMIGCTHTPPSASATPATSVSAAEPTVIGTWLFHYANDEKETRIELSADGRWRWWPPSDGVTPSASPTQSGTWFIHQQVLVLRIKQSESDKIPAGIAFTYDVRRISAQAIILYDIFTKHEFTWKRAAS